MLVCMWIYNMLSDPEDLLKVLMVNLYLKPIELKDQTGTSPLQLCVQIKMLVISSRKFF